MIEECILYKFYQEKDAFQMNLPEIKNK